MITEIIKRIKFCYKTDRIGPDIPFTHWKLYFNSTMKKLCKDKFLFFDDSAEFRSGAYAVYCSSIKIGKNVVIRPNTMLLADESTIIDIQNNVMLGPGVQMYTDNHDFNDITRPIIEQEHYQLKNITIEKDSWIGANSIILTGVTIGEHSVIGAGSVVTKNIPSYCVAVGNPCKVIKELK